MLCLVGGLLVLLCQAQKSVLSVNPLLNQGEECFCQLKGQIDDCKCTIDTVDYFNNQKIHPRLMVRTTTIMADVGGRHRNLIQD
jgi:hypothetical protein